MAVAYGRVRRPERNSDGAVGVAVAAACLVAVAGSGETPTRLLGGVALLAVGGVVASTAAVTLSWSFASHLAAATPGALLVGSAVPELGPRWIEPATVVAAAVGGALVAVSERRVGGGALGGALWLTWIAGVYVTIPDTERALALLGAGMPIATVGWLLRSAALGSSGSLALTGLVAWVVAVDGASAPASVVGGLVAPGILLVAPFGRGRWVHEQTTLRLLAAQVAVVAVAARAGGLRSSPRSAGVIACATLVTAALVFHFGAGRSVTSDD